MAKTTTVETLAMRASRRDLALDRARRCGSTCRMTGASSGASAGVVISYSVK